MAWITQDSKQSTDLKPTWEYKTGVNFVTVLPDTTRDFAILTGDLDPTKSWMSPVEAWVHQFKTATGFATVICDKWNEACPLCYENEIFKQQHPNYKDEKKKTPFPISSKALVQVYDFQEQKVLWLLAGREIISGMDFILTRQAQLYKGVVSITRTGSKLDTKYRVDVSPAVLDAQALAIVKAQMVTAQDWRGVMQMSHDETQKKTGIHPVQYFDRVLPKNLGVDISKWGAVPSSSAYQTGTAPVKKDTGALGLALNSTCISGIYNGRLFKDIIVEVGKSYMQYLSQASASPEEKANALIILNSWDEAMAECGRAF